MQISSAKMTETIGPQAEHKVGCGWRRTSARRVLKSINTASACRKVHIMMAMWNSCNNISIDSHTYRYRLSSQRHKHKHRKEAGPGHSPQHPELFWASNKYGHWHCWIRKNASSFTEERGAAIESPYRIQRVWKVH